METTLSQHFAKEIASRISLCRNLSRNSINVACERILLFVLLSNETVYFLNFTLTWNSKRAIALQQHGTIKNATVVYSVHIISSWPVIGGGAFAVQEFKVNKAAFYRYHSSKIKGGYIVYGIVHPYLNPCRWHWHEDLKMQIMNDGSSNIHDVRIKGELRGKNDCISGVGPFHSDAIFDIMFCWRRISSSKNYQNERPKCK